MAAKGAAIEKCICSACVNPQKSNGYEDGSTYCSWNIKSFSRDKKDGLTVMKCKGFKPKEQQ